MPSECRWQCELCEEMSLAQADVKDPHQPSHHLLERDGWVHRQGVFKSIMAVRPIYDAALPPSHALTSFSVPQTFCFAVSCSLCLLLPTKML